MYVTHAVSGEANFTIHHIGLTVGGFTQPSVARNILEHQANVEKGLCQRFLWSQSLPAQHLKICSVWTVTSPLPLVCINTYMHTYAVVTIRLKILHGVQW